MGLNVAHHGRRAEQIVGRDIEKSLDLAGVEVDGQHPVGAGAGDEIGDELGRDRRARRRLSILAGVAEIGDDRGDALRRGAPQRVDHDEQLHQVVVRRVGRRLDDEGVASAHILENFDEDLEVGEPADVASGQRLAEIGGDRLGERPIGIAGQNLHLAEHGRFSNPAPEARFTARTRRVIAAAPTPNNMTFCLRRPLAGGMSTRKPPALMLRSAEGAGPHAEERRRRVSKHGPGRSAAPRVLDPSFEAPTGRLRTRVRTHVYWA